MPDVAVRKKKKSLPPEGLHFNQDRHTQPAKYGLHMVIRARLENQAGEGLRNDPGERNWNSHGVEPPSGRSDQGVEARLILPGGKYPRQRKLQKPWEVGTSLTPSKNSKKRAGQLGPGSKGIGQQVSQGVSDGQFRQGFEGHCHFTRLWLLFWVTWAATEGFGAE